MAKKPSLFLTFSPFSQNTEPWLKTYNGHLTIVALILKKVDNFVSSTANKTSDPSITYDRDIAAVEQWGFKVCLGK